MTAQNEPHISSRMRLNIHLSNMFMIASIAAVAVAIVMALFLWIATS